MVSTKFIHNKMKHYLALNSLYPNKIYLTIYMRILLLNISHMPILGKVGWYIASLNLPGVGRTKDAYPSSLSRPHQSTENTASNICGQPLPGKKSYKLIIPLKVTTQKLRDIHTCWQTHKWIFCTLTSFCACHIYSEGCRIMYCWNILQVSHHTCRSETFTVCPRVVSPSWNSAINKNHIYCNIFQMLPTYIYAKTRSIKKKRRWRKRKKEKEKEQEKQQLTPGKCLLACYVKVIRT